MWRWLTALIVFASTHAYGYAVGPGIALEELAKKSDIVVKATVTAQAAVKDTTFRELTGFGVQEVQLQVVSTIKGTPSGKTIRFRHYRQVPTNIGYGYSPLAYDLKTGRTYVVFAVKGTGGYKQVQPDHTMVDGQGVQLAADDKPHRGATTTDATWAELVALAKSPVADDAIEAIQKLDALSGGRNSELKDFDRALVANEIKPLIGSRDDAIATAAIGVFGAESPYYRDEDAPYWLAGIGKGEIPGLSPRKRTGVPITAEKELTAIATSNAKLRALAIRALGRSKVVASTVATWARDPDADVRRAAVYISAELADRTLIFSSITDPSAPVRRSAALAMGFAQEPKLLPYLDKLLKDPDGKVRAAAAMSILSFPRDQSAAVMTANLKGDYRSLFVSALARSDAKPHLALLGEVIEQNLSPPNWWGGRIPAADAWDALYAYAKQLSATAIAAPAFARSLDSLEKAKWHGSSEPRKLYALFVTRGLTARAKAFRTGLKKAVSYDMERYLDEADKAPERFIN